MYTTRYLGSCTSTTRSHWSKNWVPSSGSRSACFDSAHPLSKGKLIFFFFMRSTLQLSSDVITAGHQSTRTGWEDGTMFWCWSTRYLHRGRHVRSPWTKTTRDARGFRVCCCQGALSTLFHSPCVRSLVLIIMFFYRYWKRTKTGIPQSTSCFHRPVFVLFCSYNHSFPDALWIFSRF